MSDRIKLECTTDEFEALHDCVERTRANSETVKVPKAALAALLRDHGRLIRAQNPQIDGVR